MMSGRQKNWPDWEPGEEIADLQLSIAEWIPERCLFAPNFLPPIYNLQSVTLQYFEARAGIEPAHKGFADLSLTTWVPRHRIAN
jgi:hypothetical protein